MNKQHIISAFDGLNAFWRDAIGNVLKEQLITAIQGINSSTDPDIIVPEQSLIFNAFRLCPAPKVVLIGQDPYIHREQAHGLSFSVPTGVNVPPSLNVIYKSLVKQGAVKQMPKTGNLTSWAEQGVLLLNTALTTVIGKSNVHAAHWEGFTNKLIPLIVKSFPGTIFILLGLQAQKYAKIIDTTQAHVLCWGHPSPLNTHNKTDNPKNFINNTVFVQANKLLVEMGRAPINWDPNAAIDISTDRTDVKTVSTDVNTVNTVNTDVNTVNTISTQKHHIWLFTDGGSRKNGKADCVASWGFVIIVNGNTVAAEKGLVENKAIDGQKYQASNNRGELTAVLNGLNWIVEHELNQSADQLTIVSDSEYTIKSITVWYPKWKAENKLFERKNIDLIEKIVVAKDKLSGAVKVNVRHEYSHTAEPTEPFAKFLWSGNDMADKLCQAALKP